MNIDPNTGLPELPENYAWAIRENRISIVTQTVGPWYDIKRKLKFYYDSNPTSYETRILENQGFFRLGTQAQYRIKSSYATEYTQKFSEVITKENILSLCNEVLLRWNKKKERESLYGIYPPKKFDPSS